MKTKFKIVFITLLIGWLPLIIALGNVHLSRNVSVALGILCGFICMAAMFLYTAFLNNVTFWMKQAELEKEIEANYKRAKLYEEAKDELIKYVLENKK
jgi:hypothetical protein